MSTDPTNDVVPSDVGEFLDIYAEELPDVRFPDVDRDSLEALAGQVRERAAELARLHEEVRQAREALDQAQDELRKAACRGLAYAKIYADGNDELSGRLAELNLAPGQQVERMEKKAKRQPKSKGKSKAAGDKDAEKAPTAELPFAGRPKLSATEAA